MKVLPYRSDAERSAAAEALAEHLAAGGVVAYPTETVYGLGCALLPEALERLAAFKGDRPFLLLIEDPDAALALRWTPAATRLARRFWPGPLTLALDDPAEAYPARVRGEEGTVAVRVSPHPAIPWLLEAAHGPLTSTSANRPGEPPARSARSAAELAGALEPLLVLDGGELPPGRPSTIVRCGDAVAILRDGAIPRADLDRALERE